MVGNIDNYYYIIRAYRYNKKYVFIVIDQNLPPDQRSLNYIRQLEAKVKELEEEKSKLSKKMIQEEKIDQKINNWNTDGSFPVSRFRFCAEQRMFCLIKIIVLLCVYYHVLKQTICFNLQNLEGFILNNLLNI